MIYKSNKSMSIYWLHVYVVFGEDPKWKQAIPPPRNFENLQWEQSGGITLKDNLQVFKKKLCSTPLQKKKYIYSL